jgi:hypothetical protein
MKPYHPRKYFAGLSKTRKIKRAAEIKQYGALDWKDPRAYVGFQTDKGVKTRKSGYSQTLKRIFAKMGHTGVYSLQEKAKITGVPHKFLLESYNRGMAAWRTGHRPGASEQAWGHARVASFLVCGKTYATTDADIAARAKAASASARRWWSATCPKK